jgi:cytochrome P450
LYSTSTLVNYEPFVDRCADIFSQRLTEFAQSGKSFDMGHWFQCYAFDVIACITYGDRFGFLDKGKDIDDTIAHLWNVMWYSTIVGIYAEYHKALWPFTSRMPWTGGAGRQYIMDFVQAQLDKRKSERKKRDMKSGHARTKQVTEGTLPEDFLEKILNAQEENPQKITPADVYALGQSNIIAGSDTTAISLCTILYHLLKYPRTMEKLRDEIREKEEKGECGNSRVTFKESLGMPYFQAVMKEALRYVSPHLYILSHGSCSHRMHPATGLPLWRVVPAGGATISNRFFPANSVIGVNTWTAHYNTDVFGPDATTFRPERWLEASPEQLKRMDAYYMPFGLGSRTCLGRHISELEMAKLIPRLVRGFEFELVKKGGEWETENYWFVKPMDFEVKVRIMERR